MSIYSHENVRVWDHLRFNCYGFISYLLQQVSPPAYEEVVRFMYENGDRIPVSIDGIPCPFHYSAFFTSLIQRENAYWVPIADPTELRPGDLMAYLPVDFVPQKISEMPTERDGTHLMVVDEVKSVSDDRIELTIIDCTRYRHSPEDSRIKDGIGKAPLTILRSESRTVLQWGSRKMKWEKNLFFARLKNRIR